jgi:acid phosphatase type 7
MKSAISLMLFTVALCQAADKVIGGPYVVNAGPTAATVGWVIQSGEATIGSDPSATGKTGPMLHSENVTFTGLEPGTTYYYNAGKDSGKGSFKTPPVGPADFEFVTFGDTRTRVDAHKRVIDAVLKYSNPDFVVHHGDLVQVCKDSSLWPLFFDAERELLRKVAFYPAIGGHERDCQLFYDFFHVNSRYRSFDWGPAHFSILYSESDKTLPVTAAEWQAFWDQQKRWLEEDLAKNPTAQFRFVISHTPPYGSKLGAEHPEIIDLMPVLEKYHVNAVICGNDHNYQHYEKNGVHYITTGGGGAPLEPKPTAPHKVLTVEHFVRIKIAGSSAHADAIGTNGKVLDSYDLK